MNPYTYVGDDPINYVDPSGLSSIKDAGGGAAGGTAGYCPDCELLTWSSTDCGNSMLQSIATTPFKEGAKVAWRLWRTGQMAIKLNPWGFSASLLLSCGVGGLSFGGLPE